MELFGHGIVLIVNGALDLLGRLASPVAVAAVVIAVGLAWMARLEIDEVNRSASKPEIGIH